jgi:hypothetical protein
LLLPAAVIFVNDKLFNNTLSVIKKQLFITLTLTGQQFDSLVQTNPLYHDWVVLNNQRVLVIRNDYDNLTPLKTNFADVVVFIESGLVSIKKNKYGRPGLLLRTSDLNWGKLNIINSASLIGQYTMPLTFEQVLFYGNHTGNAKPIYVDSGSAIIGDGYLKLPLIISEVGGDLDGYLPNPSVVGLHDSTGTALTYGQIPDGYFLQRIGNQLVGVPVAHLEVTNLAVLSTLSPVSVSQVAWVDTLQCLFVATPAGLGTPDGIEYVSGVGVVWQRILGATSAYWQQVTDWHVDADAGNDENDGQTPATALKTADEIQRRWGPNPVLKQSVTIHIEDDIDLLQLYAKTASRNVTITVIGNATLTYQSTISAISDVDFANNTATRLKVSGVTDWNLFLNGRLEYLTSNNSYAWVAKASPLGVGNDTARTTVGYYFNNTPARDVPTVGTTAAIIYTLPTINHVNINIQSATNESGLNTYQSLVIDSINCDGSFSVRTGESFSQVLIKGCNLSCALDLPSTKDVVRLVSCKISPTAQVFPNGSYLGCLIDGINYIDVQNQYFTETLFQNVSLNVLGGTFLNLNKCQIFDGYGDGLTINAGAVVSAKNGLSGQGSGNIGVNIIDGGELIYNNGRPTITAAVSECRFNNTNVNWVSVSTPNGILPSLLANYLSLLGGSMAGAIDMNSNAINNVPLPVISDQPITLRYIADGYISQDVIAPGFNINSFGLNTSLQKYRGDSTSGISASISFVGGPPISANISTSYSGSTNAGDINPGTWSINSPFTSGSLAGTLKRIGTDGGEDPVVTFTLTENTSLVSKTRTISVTYSDLIFWGVGSVGPINPTGIQSLPGNALQPTHINSFTVSPNNQKVYYCAPSRLGLTTFSLNGFPFSFLPVYTVGPVVNVNSVTTTYNVFESAQLLTGTLQLIRTS